MTQPIALNVTLKGRIFTGEAGAVIKRAIYDEALVKINDRLMRKGSQGSGGTGLGVRRNIVRSTMRREANELLISSTLRSPRRTGRAYVRKQIAIVKSMAPRVIRSIAKRVEAEL